MSSRRKVLKTLSGIPLVGGFLNPSWLHATPPKGNLTETFGPASGPMSRNFFKELGLRTFINAAGTYTSMTGSLMSKEVTDAIQYAATEYVKIDELQDKVGERIATLLNCEYATVSSGAFGAMSIGMGGAMCGMDMEKVTRLPDTTGLKNEVILQEGHNIGYTQALTNTGAKLVRIKTSNELENAITPKTAMLWFLNASSEEGEIKHEEFVALGKKHDIPTFIDCAADVPPVENLFKFTKLGFDMVAFSGGKGIRGPQSAGLLLGKRKYIEAARLHCPPRTTTIARGMKVNKEEVLGMLVALELYLAKDHKREWALWENQIQLIHDSAASVKGVTPEIHVPPHANHVPSLKIRWDENVVRLTKDELRQQLRDGHPSIETVGNKEMVGITTWMMEPGQEREVARRIKEILKNAS